MARTEFSKSVRYAAWTRAGGFCENPKCKMKLYYGKYQYHHGKEDTFGGAATVNNCVVLCIPCHAEITGKQAKIIAKNNRQRNKNIGVKRKIARPLMGTKASGWKQKMSGEWERR